uniref:Advanced glycosylation end product-specific receptor variant 7 n=1 Tax=Sus scrofa TaxID=9823 RepID=F1ABR1_PIG|nr:advanced glycosylation end product-specific receptor variant 7 [Sus scrofa]
MAGVPNKVGTCVSEGGYPAGTLSWHLDGKTLIPDGKGVSVKEETRRHPETGLFTLHSELMVTPAWGGAPQPTFSCSFSPSFPRRRALHTAPIRPSVWEPVPLEEVQLVVEPAGGAVPPGGTVTLTCETSVQPPPQIHWTKDGTPLPLSPSPGDPGRPGDRRPARRGHHVAQAATQRTGEEGPRKPGGRRGGACGAEPAGGSRGG